MFGHTNNLMKYGFGNTRRHESKASVIPVKIWFYTKVQRFFAEKIKGSLSFLKNGITVGDSTQKMPARSGHEQSDYQ